MPLPQTPQELWALSRNDEKDQIVLLRRSCERCEPGHKIPQGNFWENEQTDTNNQTILVNLIVAVWWIFILESLH